MSEEELNLAIFGTDEVFKNKTGRKYVRIFFKENSRPLGLRESERKLNVAD